MTTLETLHKQISKEYRRIEILKNSPSNGIVTWFDFVDQEIKEAKKNIEIYKVAFKAEYEYQNSI